MTIDKFLDFLISHNATIIEVLIGLTLLAILLLSIRMFLFATEPSISSANIDMGQLEGTLKQILEKAGQVPSPAANANGESSGSSEGSQKLLAEISHLKGELEARQQQIETLKSAPAVEDQSVSGLSNEEKAQLESQIQELQAKLSEYEIISEDIADLSFYKEQNVKLQKEIDALKVSGTGASSGDASAASTPEPMPEPAVSSASPLPAAEPEIVGKSKVEKATVEENPFEEALAASGDAAAGFGPDTSSPPAGAAEGNVIDDDLMAEFAAAVEKQKTGTESDESLAPKSTDQPAAKESSLPTEESTVDLGQMDMDKMLAEAADIKTDVPEVDPEIALGTGLDENKLLQEAAALDSVTSEDKKLMGDFENFVKKSES